MGKPCFSRIIKFFAIALLGAATAIAAIAVLSSPAAAQRGGGGGRTEKPWDTDNLRYTQGGTTYTAKNFRVPYHKYGSYATDTTASAAAKAACRGGGIADGFFQTDAAGRNDFPELKKVSGEWEISATGSKTSGCTAFVDAQLQMAERARGNGGYYLDSQGNLQKAEDVAGSRFLVAPASRVRTYATWNIWDLTTPYSTQGSSGIQRSGVGGRGFVSTADAVPTSVKAYGLDAFTLNSFTCSSVRGGLSQITGTPDYYLARTDNQRADRQGSGSYARVSSPQPSGAWEPSAAALSADNERVVKSVSIVQEYLWKTWAIRSQYPV